MSRSPLVPDRLARRAGAGYLVVTVGGLFAELGVRARLLTDDPVTTLAAVAANQGLFRAGLLADLVTAAAFAVTAVLLTVLLRPVHRGLALGYLAVNLVGVAVMALNMVNHLAVLILATHPDLAVDAPGLTLLFVELHGGGYRIAGLFYGLGLLALGLLLLRSRYVPRVLGRLLVVTWAGYPAALVLFLLAPALNDLGLALAAAAGVSELALMGWLLVRGVHVPSHQEALHV